ncbi:hypothetical protein BDV33DRAFT_18824 [Aspergillus novoparasiticus]|uniref:Uncharacterized protein n=1 Tax=Aspergillus novoparasiticus TaxID=986946 RepID=A0A5N6F340_9EURO|nr:hypothetical protein BDV33DRAFT_18824 [Aspergillus novoparasiticus]
MMTRELAVPACPYPCTMLEATPDPSKWVGPALSHLLAQNIPSFFPPTSATPTPHPNHYYGNETPVGAIVGGVGGDSAIILAISFLVGGRRGARCYRLTNSCCLCNRSYDTVRGI